MAILVLETAVLLDLSRGELLQAAFGLDHEFLIPDIAFERQLEDASLRDYLRRLGLFANELTAAEMGLARRVQQGNGRISFYECCSVACAKRPNHELVTDEVLLREEGARHSIKCRGVLDLLDEIHDERLSTPATLMRALLAIAKSKPNRLDDEDVQQRLEAWALKQTKQNTRSPTR